MVVRVDVVAGPALLRPAAGKLVTPTKSVLPTIRDLCTGD